MHKITVRVSRPLAWAVVLVCITLPAMALPPIMYPDPPASGGSGGSSGSCTNDTTAAGCSHTYKQSSRLQVWCGSSRGWVYISSESCFYDAYRNSACCTYQKQECTYTDSSGTTQIVEATLAKQETCATQ